MFARPLSTPIALTDTVTEAAVIDIDATLRKHIRQQFAKIGARVGSIEAVDGSKKQFHVRTNATYSMVKYNPFIELIAMGEFDGGVVVQVPSLLLLCATYAARPDVYGAGGAGKKYQDVMVGLK